MPTEVIPPPPSAQKKEGMSNTMKIGGAAVAAGALIFGSGLSGNNAKITNDTAVENNTQAVLGIDALEQRVTNNEEDKKEDRDDARADLKETEDGINAQINRREVENIGYIDTLDEKQDALIKLERDWEQYTRGLSHRYEEELREFQQRLDDNQNEQLKELRELHYSRN